MTPPPFYITVVVPCHNEEPSLPLFVADLARSLDNTQLENDCEVLFVNDGSSDGTQRIVESLKRATGLPFVVSYIQFSRNFGKEAAIQAGLSQAQGQFVAIMDADLQDPPQLLPSLVEKLKADPEIDIIRLRRSSRKGEPFFRSAFSRLFYRIINKVSAIEIVDGARDYQVMRRYVAQAISSMPERNRFFKGMTSWVGFNTQWEEFENIERPAGKSSWSFTSLLKYALEGITSFSTAPLLFSALVGLLACAISIFALLFIVIRFTLFGDPVAGWPSTICIIVLFGGMQMACIGILGQYLAKVYLEVKLRPLYIVKQEYHARESKNERDAEISK